jgi:hypothetical protein
MFSKSPGLVKWPRCLNLNVAKASPSQRTCEAVVGVCLYQSHSGLFSSPRLNEFHFKWHCPVSNPVIILSWFLFRLSSSSACFTEGFLRKPLSCLFQHMDYQSPSCFLLFHSMTMPGNLCRYTKHRPRSCEWMWGACSDQLSAILFPSISMCPTSHTSCPCYVLPVSPGTDDHPRIEWSWEVMSVEEFYSCNPHFYSLLTQV